MLFHRPLLWLASLSALFLLFVLLGWDLLGGIMRLHTHSLRGENYNEDVHSIRPPQTAMPTPPKSPQGERPSMDDGGAEDSARGGDSAHVQYVAVDSVSADQPDVRFVESLVPMLSEMSEEAWARATVPSGLLYFLEIRTSKLISLAQLIRADASLSLADHHRLMQRLVVNLHAVTRVGERLCDEIEAYVDRVAARAVGEVEWAEASSAHAPSDTERHLHTQHIHSNVFLRRRCQNSLEDAQAGVLTDLEARNPSWREAVRVCRMLHSKAGHFMPIINSLLNEGSAHMM